MPSIEVAGVFMRDLVFNVYNRAPAGAEAVTGTRRLVIRVPAGKLPSLRRDRHATTVPVTVGDREATAAAAAGPGAKCA